MSLFEKWPYIIAGCRQEAVSCAKKNDCPAFKFYYISTLNQVMTIPRDSEVWACGEYCDLKQWPEMEKGLIARGIKPTYKVC